MARQRGSIRRRPRGRPKKQSIYSVANHIVNSALKLCHLQREPFTPNHFCLGERKTRSFFKQKFPDLYAKLKWRELWSRCRDICDQYSHGHHDFESQNWENCAYPLLTMDMERNGEFWVGCVWKKQQQQQQQEEEEEEEETPPQVCQVLYFSEIKTHLPAMVIQHWGLQLHQMQVQTVLMDFNTEVSLDDTEAAQRQCHESVGEEVEFVRHSRGLKLKLQRTTELYIRLAKNMKSKLLKYVSNQAPPIQQNHQQQQLIISDQIIQHFMRHSLQFRINVQHHQQ
eukprot:TRINITY_DN686_c0_g2_i1.p1 TRINITY_DN686_c0_g2~~TRINITY_DN686_c0_g2_i1.p1  ORF type:complete len:283 (-),score=57.32 TRINITY_DN686_c0_g2_i1:122-970(-)